MNGSKELISLITEELNKLINEYDENQNILETAIDLNEEYNKLNQQLFGGKLPEVPLKFGPTKRSYGRVVGTVNRMTREVKVSFLEISEFYKMTYRQFKNILAHEMIHVYQMAVMQEKGGHGWDFMREARRINGMGLEFEITERNGEDMAVADDIKANAKKRTLIAIVINIDGNYSVTLTTPSVYNAEADQVFNIFDKAVNVYGKYREVEITVIETQNPELMGMPVARTFKRRISSVPLSDRLLEVLLNDKIIKEVKIKKGAPMTVSEQTLPSNVSNNPGELEQIEIS